MASLVAQPEGDIITLDKCLAWKITGGFSTTPGITNVILARLLCDGQPVSDIQQYVLCKEGEEIPIDFTNKADCLLYTCPPDCSNPTGKQTAPDAVKEFTLQLGEITIDDDDCEGRIKPEELEAQLSDAHTVKVINGYCNTYDDQEDNNAVLVLSSRPSVYSICSCTKDWLYVAGLSGGGNVDAIICKKDGTANSFQILGTYASGEVCKIPIGVCQIADMAGVSVGAIKNIQVRVGGVNRYLVLPKKCCCKGECRFDLYFLSPKGGVDVFPMECLDSVNINREGTQICLEQDCFGTVEENMQRYGNKYISKNAWCAITATVEKKLRARDLPFMKSLGAATAFYHKAHGKDILEAMLLAGSEIPVFKKKGKATISFTGLIANPIKTHTIN